LVVDLILDIVELVFQLQNFDWLADLVFGQKDLNFEIQEGSQSK
jgi:hypothetical protein